MESSSKASFPIKFTCLPTSINTSGLFVIQLHGKSGYPKNVDRRTREVINVPDVKRVDFAIVILPTPLNSAFALWNIILATNDCNNTISAWRLEVNKHLLIIANVNVGWIVTNNGPDVGVQKRLEENIGDPFVNIEKDCIHISSEFLLPT